MRLPGACGALHMASKVKMHVNKITNDDSGNMQTTNGSNHAGTQRFQKCTAVHMKTSI
jgi:hypothetical protein